MFHFLFGFSKKVVTVVTLSNCDITDAAFAIFFFILHNIYKLCEFQGKNSKILASANQDLVRRLYRLDRNVAFLFFEDLFFNNSYPLNFLIIQVNNSLKDSFFCVCVSFFNRYLYWLRLSENLKKYSCFPST